mgnify:CR=1 FL=1
MRASLCSVGFSHDQKPGCSAGSCTPIDVTVVASRLPWYILLHHAPVSAVGIVRDEHGVQRTALRAAADAEC